MTIEEEIIFQDYTECVIYKVVDQGEDAALTTVLDICLHENIGQSLHCLLESEKITDDDISTGVICYTTKESFAENSVKLN
jgi:hypothetical protein